VNQAKRSRSFFFAALLAISATPTFGLLPVEWTMPSTNGLRDLAPFLESYLEKHELPALAAAVVHGDRIVGAGVFGERKIGSGVRVRLEDKFHIGSCTKSMTGLLAGELAAENKIRLTTKVSAVFPEWGLDDEKSGITLDLLLQNRSGLGNKPPSTLWSRAFHDLKGEPAEQRREFLQEFLKQPLDAAPGAKYIYSNIGFALAGAMMEESSKSSWEDLIRTQLFKPLGLTSGGFGAPATNGRVDQPWGHRIRDGKLSASEPGDNPVAIAPAGAVHLSVIDAARYAAFHLQVFNGEVPALEPVRERLYTPPEGSDYAFGWIVQKRGWAGGVVLTHAGSNTTFYTVIWIAPVRNFAFVVMTNAGEREGDVIASKVDDVVAALITEFVR
jgi:CubicO group peptidase (beta-lactamase class C family)